MAGPGRKDLVAAVDLGSNSFHLVIARTSDHGLRVLDRLKEPVRLAAGLTGDGTLSEAAEARAIDCLRRFGQRVRDLPADQLRAVGTSALRQAKNRKRFLGRAEAALGHAIEIVAGREEARLIYLGVAHSVPDGPERRLVVDIGGGSTECILGEHFEPIQADSLHMGSVNFSLRFFPRGELRREAFRKAEIAARREIRTIERRFKTLGFEVAIGSSGTILAIAEILRANAWSKSGVTRGGLKKLKRAMIDAGTVDDLAFEGLRSERAPILAGGLAILRALFDALEIERMAPSPGAMREGLLYDLLGRIRHEDGREIAIRRFAERHHVDQVHAARVEKTAVGFLRQLAASWELELPQHRQMLVWAARVHEVGMVVAYSGYHKHGAYLVANSDLPGFSTDDQLILAALVRSHRRRISRADFTELPGSWAEDAFRLAVILRVAVLLNRSRSPRRLPTVTLRSDEDALVLTFPEDWLAHHALTRADLDEESAHLAAAGIRFEVR